MTETDILILMLMVDSAIVFFGLTRKKNMWAFIVVYWLILTIKNMIDFMKIL